jgi:hypothetical protein
MWLRRRILQLRQLEPGELQQERIFIALRGFAQRVSIPVQRNADSPGC